MQTQTKINVWDVKKFFETNNTFPQMSDEDRKYFIGFAKCQVSDTIEAYERYTYNHGGQRQEAKDILTEIEKAEKMYKAIKESSKN